MVSVAERKVAIQRQQLELKKKQEAQKRALTEVSVHTTLKLNLSAAS